MSTDLGQLDNVDGRWELRFTRNLPHPPEKVWRVLTEPEHLEAWFPMRMEGDRVPGAALRFTSGEGDPPIDGKMLAFDPPSILELQWGDDETLRFELRPDGHGTALTFVNRFDEKGKAARDGAGWHVCLDVLAAHLDGNEPAWGPRERWEQVHPMYVEQLGPEASTIGPPEGH